GPIGGRVAVGRRIVAAARGLVEGFMLGVPRRRRLGIGAGRLGGESAGVRSAVGGGRGRAFWWLVRLLQRGRLLAAAGPTPPAAQRAHGPTPSPFPPALCPPCHVPSPSRQRTDVPCRFLRGAAILV